MNDVDKVISKFRKKYGAEGGDILSPTESMTASLLSQVKIWVPSGIDGLDAVLGVAGKGLAAGKLVEMYGPESHGKSSLLYYIIGRVQQAGGIFWLIDSEYSYDPEWGEKLGVDRAKLKMLQGNLSLEEYFDRIEFISKELRKADTDIPIMWAFDTIYATATHESLNAESYTDKSRVAALARAMSQSLPRFLAFLAKYQVGMIFINQVRDNIGVFYGEQFITPGGRAIKHGAAVRVMVKRTKKHASGNIESKAVNVKNKLGRPFQQVAFKIDQRQGIVELKSKG